MRVMGDAHGRDYAVYHGDSCEILPQLPDRCIDHCIYSPPFGSLFTYSEYAADIGNCANDEEFFGHYEFIVKELVRLIKPGRICAVHCSDLPTRKWKDGYIGLDPFSDRLREAHECAGFIFYRRITIWKDPVAEMTRTKALNLLYKQLCKDSAMSAPGLPDYLLIFRAPGENAVPVRQTPDKFPLSQWQEWASPVWMTVSQGDVLNVNGAREQADERHVCPLQLDVIRRSVVMWSNPGDVVLSPFMGIGSEGYVALREGRRFVGVELKDTYFRQAHRNLASVEATPTLFTLE